MPEKTNAEFRPDGFFITGDMARYDENGFLYLVGRAKDLIITGGYNVYPKEIEEELDAMDMIHGSWLQKFERLRHDYLHHIN